MSKTTSTILYEEDEDGYIYPILKNNDLNQEDAVVRSPSPEITFRRSICISGNNIEVDTKIPNGTLSPEFKRKIYQSTLQDRVNQSLNVLLDQDGKPVLITANIIAETAAVDTSTNEKSPIKLPTTNSKSPTLPGIVRLENTTNKRTFAQDEITTYTTTYYEEDNINPAQTRKKH